MVNLDDTQIYKQLNPENMRGHLHGLPQQCRTAWHKANDFKLPKDYANIDKVVILGMGGSAIGGDLVRSLFSSKKKPIIFVSRDYDLPAFVDVRTLVIASSYSGNTEETLSAFSQALQKKCKRLAMTTGGRLKELAEDAKVPVFLIDYVAQPRAAVGYGFMSLIAFLQKLGHLEDKTAEVEAMIQDIEKLLGELKETVPTSSNRAKQLAAKLHGKIAVIYGAGILSEVAHRWKTQINENSKSWAFYDIFPELNHNAVVGYQFPPELASKMYVVLLRCPSLHPRMLIRYQATSELLKQSGISHETIDSQGKGELSQMMNLIYLGDWVSYYLAILNEIDPTPVKAIDYLKKRLSQSK
ncbi:MAG: bifunctional phosphoglucose/phosphomannose isomerase [Chloroflexi bacterium RBG_13_50_10]|nr:MAG: bifunctional phosphoglucose/phosphomannose isomerase [Chloroflexi bacterium RBG_13_50_10]